MAEPSDAPSVVMTAIEARGQGGAARISHQKHLLVLALFALLLASCGPQEKFVGREGYLTEATRAYPRETRERVIKAAQTVLEQAAPNKFEFRYRLNGFIASRHFFMTLIIISESGTSNWEFTADPDATGGILASVQHTVDSTHVSTTGAQHSNKEMNYVALYRLFWNRVDYVLGRAPEWMSCADATAAFGASNRAITAWLCVNEAANPPPQLPPLPKAPTAKR